MNLSQLHEHLRVELLRRIQRGTLSISLLARQTGYGRSHLSNFLRSRKQLSLQAMDSVLKSQRLSAEDLLPVAMRWQGPDAEGESSAAPLVSHAAALFEPVIRPSAVQTMVHLPAGSLKLLRARSAAGRRAWHRFVAVRIPSADAPPMEPVVLPEAIVLIDRHYNSLAAYRSNQPNLYAVRNGSHLSLRYVSFLASRLVLRPHNMAFPVELIELGDEESPGDLLAGRVAMVFNEV